jgi:hypothetical protein
MQKEEEGERKGYLRKLLYFWDLVGLFFFESFQKKTTLKRQSQISDNLTVNAVRKNSSKKEEKR